MADRDIPAGAEGLAATIADYFTHLISRQAILTAFSLETAPWQAHRLKQFLGVARILSLGYSHEDVLECIQDIFHDECGWVPWTLS